MKNTDVLRKINAGLRKENEQMRGLLLWALYHHQGGHSEIGQPIRALLQIGQFEHMTYDQISLGRSTAESLATDPDFVSKDMNNETPSKEYWLQSEIQQKGWGPFKTEDSAWKYLFGRVSSKQDRELHKKAGWSVGYVNKWPRRCG